MFDRGLCRVAVLAPHGHVASLAPGLLGLLMLSLAAFCALIAGDDYQLASSLSLSALPFTQRRRQLEARLARSANDIARCLGQDEDERSDPDTASARDFRPGPVEGAQREVFLSDREREILMMVSSGRSVDEIASELILSPATVKTHLQRIYRRLEVSDRAAAVAKAIRDGLID